MATRREEKEMIEKLIDLHGTRYVLNLLQDVAYEKAEHIAETYGTKDVDVKAWNKVGDNIERMKTTTRFPL